MLPTNFLSHFIAAASTASLNYSNFRNSADCLLWIFSAYFQSDRFTGVWYFHVRFSSLKISQKRERNSQSKKNVQSEKFSSDLNNFQDPNYAQVQVQSWELRWRDFPFFWIPSELFMNATLTLLPSTFIWLIIFISVEASH